MPNFNMPNFISLVEKPLTSLLSQLGYAKATQSSGMGEVNTILRGEVSPFSNATSLFVKETDEYLYHLGLANYAVYRNIMLIGRVVGEGLMQTQEKTGDRWTTIPDHDFTKITEYRPNPIMSQSFIWIYQTVWLMLAGEAYWVTAEDETGALKYLYPIPANRIEPIPNPRATAEAPIIGYSYKPIQGAAPEFIDKSRVCFHRLPNPFEYWRGLSPLMAYKLGLKVNYEAQKTDLEDYTNRLRLQHLLSVKSGMSNREYAIALEDLQTAERQGNRWRLIRAGDFSAKEISSPRSKDSTWIYKLTESEANGIFGVPDGIWSLDANRASAQEHRSILIENTVWPLMRMIAEDQTAQLVVPKYGEGFRVVFSDIRPRNREQDVIEETWRTKRQTYNEVRADNDLPPHPDSDIGSAPFDAAARVAVTKVAKGYRIDGSGEVLGQIEEKQLEKIEEPVQENPDKLDENQTLEDEGAIEENPKEVLPAAQVEKKSGELRKWKAVVLKLESRNKSLTDYDFKTELLTLNDKKDIIAKLKCITSNFPKNEIVTPKRAVKAIFSGRNLGIELREEYEEKVQELIRKASEGLEKSAFIAEIGLLTDAYLLSAMQAGSSGSAESAIESLKLAELKSIAMLAADQLWQDSARYLSEELNLESKSDLWGSVIGYAFAFGLVRNSEDPNLMWSVGNTDHCSDCQNNNGKVMKASEWQKYPLPQDRALECGGYRCECSLNVVS